MTALRPILRIVALLAAIAAGARAFAADGERAPNVLPVVVELFTSQGCSSCPPSDAFLGDLSKRPDVIALAFHVDYWDYIGWADPFARPAYTERQRNYARALHQRYVYTPEMVVSGMAHDSGMDRSTVLGLIDRAHAQAGERIPVGLSDGGAAGVSISVPPLTRPAPADVWLVTFDPQHKTQVTRGENRGRDLIDYNVVRSLTLLTQWDGQAAGQWTVPIDRLGDAAGVAVLIQHREQGTMLGAAQLRRAGR